MIAKLFDHALPAAARLAEALGDKLAGLSLQLAVAYVQTMIGGG